MSGAGPVRVLWVATKSPWPPHDGGRLLMARTLEALDPSRVRVTLAFPSTDRDQESAAAAVVEVLSVRAEEGSGSGLMGLPRCVLGSGPPWTARRHRHHRLHAQVAERLAGGDVDVVHAEQPHALTNVPATDVPVLLRAQNVEGDLWTRYARSRRGPLRHLLLRQAAAVRRWELEQARRAAVVATVSAEDRERFVELGVECERAVHLPPPFPERLEGARRPLDGDPALVMLSGSRWRPNRLGERSFLDHCWPAVVRAVPGARLHLFGAAASSARLGVQAHPRPFQTADLFPPEAVLLVPVETTSGIRMKILDAWARGVAVISSPAGVRGLDRRATTELPVPSTAEQWVQAVRRLRDPEERRRQVAVGRSLLADLHAPEKVARRLLSLYRTATGARRDG